MEQLLVRLAAMPSVAARPPHRSDYDRAAFGPSWTDAAGVNGSRNGCDTRNDVLRRDLTEVRLGTTSNCSRAVLAGELVSPYSGQFVTFARGRNSAAVQIDHIVPLSYAWDMGAYAWTLAERTDLANDPANLVAVDANSNQNKGDLEPGRWMPTARRFHCQYAAQFVGVANQYGLAIDAASVQVLTGALRAC